MKPKHPAGSPMTLGNMRALGVQRLVASCGKCGSRRLDVRPNWKEQAPSESLTGKRWR